MAAGDGLRFGSDKQSADLGGVSVLERSVATASDVSDGVVVVVGESRVEGARTLLAGVVGVVEVVSGGATR
ncbi:MAG: NTP transferase domain-containing protein, partial [Victivallales bacterium]|nr:NTP transferase domain-containing protein [Victivallales bacterium]